MLAFVPVPPADSPGEPRLELMFQNSKFKITFKTKNNVFDLINKKTNTTIDHNKNDYERSGIYKINCPQCDMYYIGQTGRKFKVRYKEHVQAYNSKNNTSQKSKVAEHMIEKRHNFKSMEEDLQIIEYGTKSKKLDVKEEFHIYKNSQRDPNKLLNKMQINQNNIIFEKILKL